MTIRALAASSLLTLFTFIVPVLAQPPAAPTTAAFDAADVHTSPFARVPNMDGPNFYGDRYILHQATMTQMIALAYRLDTANVYGGPSWLDWNHYDIVAKAPPATSWETLQLMLQSLLAERFGLVAHKGMAPLPSYVLTAESGKTKLKESDGKGDSGCKQQQQPDGAAIDSAVSCHNETMEQFADAVRGLAGPFLSQPVVDSTGLKGGYDFDLKWTSRGSLIRAGADGVTIFDAVDKQLGLKLTLGTAPRPVLTVDSVKESPTPNAPDLAKRMPPLPPAQFEVATIRPFKPDEKEEDDACGDQVRIQAATLKDLINSAWGLNQFDPDVLVGAPKWLGEDRFDIHAKLESEGAGGAAPNVCELPDEEKRQLLRTLIEDRFQMKDHWEERPGTAYHLVADNPKMTPGTLQPARDATQAPDRTARIRG